MRRLTSKGLLSLGFATMLAACGAAPESSDIKVTNGRELKETDFPSVVLLYDAKAGSICTGTFITPTVVLTAAHCTMGGAVSSDGTVDLELAIIRIADPENKQAELIAKSEKVIRNPLWDRNGKNVNKWDLGLVQFPEGTAKAVSEIATRQARVGDRFEIVGYGLNTSSTNDPSSAGIKRFGTNKVGSMSGGFIQFNGANKTTTGDGTNSSAGSGDSGGPLFIDGKVAGVTSGGGWGGFSSTRSLYIDLWSPESRAFLSTYLD